MGQKWSIGRKEKQPYLGQQDEQMMWKDEEKESFHG
jgi:hypothetical protein